jgi:hypothetical protein
MTPTVLILAIAFVFLAAMKKQHERGAQAPLGPAPVSANGQTGGSLPPRTLTPYGGRIYDDEAESRGELVGIPDLP